MVTEPSGLVESTSPVAFWLLGRGGDVNGDGRPDLLMVNLAALTTTVRA
jgi:hypothetical protein